MLGGGIRDFEANPRTLEPASNRCHTPIGAKSIARVRGAPISCRWDNPYARRHIGLVNVPLEAHKGNEVTIRMFRP